MKPFNLEKALAGEKVVTGAGKEVTELTYFKTIYGDYKVRAVIEGELDSFTEEGQWETNGKNEKRDLFMAPIQKTNYMIQCNGVLGTARFEDKKEALQHIPVSFTSDSSEYNLVTLTWEE